MLSPEKILFENEERDKFSQYLRLYYTKTMNSVRAKYFQEKILTKLRAKIPKFFALQAHATQTSCMVADKAFIVYY